MVAVCKFNIILSKLIPVITLSCFSVFIIPGTSSHLSIIQTLCYIILTHPSMSVHEDTNSNHDASPSHRRNLAGKSRMSERMQSKYARGRKHD